MRVLTVIDDPVSTKLVETTLRSECIVMEAAACSEDALDLAKHYDFDAIILVDPLPDIDCFNVIRRMRAFKIKAPLLVLSRKQDIENRVRALSTGADDYLTFPFHKSELLARLYAIVRRTRNWADSTIRIGKLAINIESKVVEIGGRQLHVTDKEYLILELLALRGGSTITKEMFLDHLYGGIDEPELPLIDVFISKLRKKIGVATGGDYFIKTVWGRGYTLPNGDDDELSYDTEDELTDSLIPRADKLMDQAIEIVRILNNSQNGCDHLISDNLKYTLEKVSDCIELIYIKRKRQSEFHQFMTDIYSAVVTLEQLVPHLHLDLSVSYELARECQSASVEMACAEKAEAVAVGAGTTVPPATSAASGWIEGEAFQTDAYKMLADYAKCKAKSRTRLETFLCTMVMVVECLRKVIPLVPSQKSSSKTR